MSICVTTEDSDGDETITTSLPLINLTCNLIIMVLWILSRLSNVKVFPKRVSKLRGKIMARQVAQEKNSKTKDEMNYPSKSTRAKVCTQGKLN